MRNLTLLFSTCCMLFLWSCSKDVNSPETNVDPTAQLIQEAEDRIAQAEKQIEEDAVFPRTGNTVVLSEGSVDELAAALAEAGENGTVIIESGNHYESGTVMITETVQIQGEPGAVLYVDVAGPSFQHDPALYVYNADDVRISGLEIRPQSAPGNTGILVYNGPNTWIEDNSIVGFGLAIWLAGADYAKVLDNYAEGGGGIWGIVAMEGKNVIIRGNEASQFGIGIFPSDRNGLAYFNETHNNGFTGILLCTAQNSSLPDGTPIQAPDAANKWLAFQNTSYENGVAGYICMDGAYNNKVMQNYSYDNGFYDIELRGDFTDGVFFPTSYDNMVVTKGPLSNLTVKDCGVNNVVAGGNMVDTSVDPCLD